MELRFLPLTPDRLPDLAALFGQGGDPKRCWCAFFRTRSRDVATWTAEGNRDVLDRALEETVNDGRAPGIIAYDGEEAVGWTGFGPREDFPRIVHSRVLTPVDAAPVWSIVCFVVGRRSRGRGIAAGMLGAVIAYARDHGATILEAYPVDLDPGQRIPSANAYRGTLAMFERAGFTVVARRRAPGAISARPIVRLAL